MTPSLLRAATGCTQDAADLYAEHLSAACEHYRIDTPVRLAAFLAQIGHESGSLHHTREIWGPTEAQRRYEGRADLGNTEPGDGERYKGRGLIQCTGRTNYRAMTNALRRFGAPDFEAEPEALEQPQWAAWTAAAWWATHGCNELADVSSFEALTRRINGGLNGLDDRAARWERAKTALATPVPTASENAPSEAPDAPTTASKEARMPIPAFLLAALPAIIEAIPKLGRVFGSGSVVAERNIKAAELVASTVVTSLGARNEQEAVQRLQTDPAAVQIATRAVDAIWFELTEAAGGGIAGARKAADAYAQPEGPRFWLNPAFWISVLLIGMPFMLLVDVFYVHPESYTGELRTQIVTGVLMVISIVGGFWLGTSFSSQRKTDLIARQ